MWPPGLGSPCPGTIFVSSSSAGMAAYGAAVPMATMEPAGPSRRAFYAKCALMATIATAVVVGSVLVMADKHEEAPVGSELGGAYYAVTKPPAFNFNSECPCFPSSSAHLPRSTAAAGALAAVQHLLPPRETGGAQRSVPFPASGAAAARRARGEGGRGWWCGRAAHWALLEPHTDARLFFVPRGRLVAPLRRNTACCAAGVQRSAPRSAPRAGGVAARQGAASLAA